MGVEGTGEVVVVSSAVIPKVDASSLFLFSGLEATLFTLTILQEKNIMFTTQKKMKFL